MHLNFCTLRIAVVGDLILDQYVDGAVGRLSPEAPVAVLLRRNERDVLGGAANVVANLVSLGAAVDVVGVVGRDGAGERLVGMLGELAAVSTAGVVVDTRRPTTCKMRVMSGLHQIVRIDNEWNAFVSAEVEAQLIEHVRHAIARCDVVIVSDYAKGVCSDRVIRTTVELAGQAGKVSIVDPKRREFSIYRGATLIKPNRRELTDAVGLPCETDDQAEAAARRTIEQTGSSVLLTRSEHGMSFFEAGKTTLHLPTAARDVFDVSGAGDTVVAVAALGFGAQMPIAETMRLANTAAGLVVAKIGTVVVKADELEAAINEQAHHLSLEQGELITLADAVRERERWRQLGLRVGFTNGCFDLLHPGHVKLLRKAAEACDRLIVAINTDASIKRLKGASRPIQDERSRAYVLGALRVVDLVVLFDEDTPAETISALRPDLLVKGADYTEDQVVGADMVKAAGGRVLLVPLVPDTSTTSMIARSLAGHPGSSKGDPVARIAQ